MAEVVDITAAPFIAELERAAAALNQINQGFATSVALLDKTGPLTKNIKRIEKQLESAANTIRGIASGELSIAQFAKLEKQLTRLQSGLTGLQFKAKDAVPPGPTQTVSSKQAAAITRDALLAHTTEADRASRDMARAMRRVARRIESGADQDLPAILGALAKNTRDSRKAARLRREGYAVQSVSSPAADRWRMEYEPLMENIRELSKVFKPLLTNVRATVAQVQSGKQGNLRLPPTEIVLPRPTENLIKSMQKALVEQQKSSGRSLVAPAQAVTPTIRHLQAVVAATHKRLGRFSAETTLAARALFSSLRKFRELGAETGFAHGGAQSDMRYLNQRIQSFGRMLADEEMRASKRPGMYGLELTGVAREFTTRVMRQMPKAEPRPTPPVLPPLVGTLGDDRHPALRRYLRQTGNIYGPAARIQYDPTDPTIQQFARGHYDTNIVYPTSPKTPVEYQRVQPTGRVVIPPPGDSGFPHTTPAKARYAQDFQRFYGSNTIPLFWNADDLTSGHGGETPKLGEKRKKLVDTSGKVPKALAFDYTSPVSMQVQKLIAANIAQHGVQADPTTLLWGTQVAAGQSLIPEQAMTNMLTFQRLMAERSKGASRERLARLIPETYTETQVRKLLDTAESSSRRALMRDPIAIKPPMKDVLAQHLFPGTKVTADTLYQAAATTGATPTGVRKHIADLTGKTPSQVRAALKPGGPGIGDFFKSESGRFDAGKFWKNITQPLGRFFKEELGAIGLKDALAALRLNPEKYAPPTGTGARKFTRAVIVDTETTGESVRGQPPQPVEVGIQEIDPKTLKPIGEMYKTLVKPTIPITQGARDIHNITDAELKNAPSFAQVAPEILRRIGGLETLVMGANVRDFDLKKVLGPAFHSVGMRMPDYSTVDLLNLARIQFAEEIKRPVEGSQFGQQNLMRHFGVAPRGTPHRVDADVLGLVDLIPRLKATDATLDELFQVAGGHISRFKARSLASAGKLIAEGKLVQKGFDFGEPTKPVYTSAVEGAEKGGIGTQPVPGDILSTLVAGERRLVDPTGASAEKLVADHVKLYQSYADADAQLAARLQPLLAKVPQTKGLAARVTLLGEMYAATFEAANTAVDKINQTTPRARSKKLDHWGQTKKDFGIVNVKDMTPDQRAAHDAFMARLKGPPRQPPTSASGPNLPAKYTPPSWQQYANNPTYAPWLTSSGAYPPPPPGGAYPPPPPGGYPPPPPPGGGYPPPPPRPPWRQRAYDYVNPMRTPYNRWTGDYENVRFWSRANRQGPQPPPHQMESMYHAAQRAGQYQAQQRQMQQWWRGGGGPIRPGGPFSGGPRGGALGGLAGYMGLHTVIQQYYRLISAMGQSIEKAAQFSIALARIQTISGEAANMGLKPLGDTVIDLATKWGQSPLTTAEALYTTISNQLHTLPSVPFSADMPEASTSFLKATNFVNDAALFGRAAATPINESVEAIASVLNSYGLGAGAASQVGAEMFKTIELGRVVGPQMRNILGRVMPLASELGVDRTEILAGIAHQTIQGMKPEESITLLSNTILRVLKPTRELNKEFERLGIMSASLAVRGRGLQGFLQHVTKYSGQAAENLGDMFGRIRAIRGVSSLVGAKAEQYKAIQERIQAVTPEDLNKAAGFVTAAPGTDYEVLKARAEAYWTNTVGPKLLEAYLGVVGTIGPERLIPGGMTLAGVGLAGAGLAGATKIMESVAGIGNFLARNLGGVGGLTAGTVGSVALPATLAFGAGYYAMNQYQSSGTDPWAVKEDRDAIAEQFQPIRQDRLIEASMEVQRLKDLYKEHARVVTETFEQVGRAYYSDVSNATTWAASVESVFSRNIQSRIAMVQGLIGHLQTMQQRADEAIVGLRNEIASTRNTTSDVIFDVSLQGAPDWYRSDAMMERAQQYMAAAKRTTDEEQQKSLSQKAQQLAVQGYSHGKGRRNRGALFDIENQRVELLEIQSARQAAAKKQAHDAELHNREQLSKIEEAYSMLSRLPQLEEGRVPTDKFRAREEERAALGRIIDEALASMQAPTDYASLRDRLKLRQDLKDIQAPFIDPTTKAASTLEKAITNFSTDLYLRLTEAGDKLNTVFSSLLDGLDAWLISQGRDPLIRDPLTIVKDAAQTYDAKVKSDIGIIERYPDLISTETDLFQTAAFARSTEDRIAEGLNRWMQWESPVDIPTLPLTEDQRKLFGIPKSARKFGGKTPEGQEATWEGVYSTGGLARGPWFTQPQEWDAYIADMREKAAKLEDKGWFGRSSKEQHALTQYRGVLAFQDDPTNTEFRNRFREAILQTRLAGQASAIRDVPGLTAAQTRLKALMPTEAEQDQPWYSGLVRVVPNLSTLFQQLQSHQASAGILRTAVETGRVQHEGAVRGLTEDSAIFRDQIGPQLPEAFPGQMPETVEEQRVRQMREMMQSLPPGTRSIPGLPPTQEENLQRLQEAMQRMSTSATMPLQPLNQLGTAATTAAAALGRLGQPQPNDISYQPTPNWYPTITPTNPVNNIGSQEVNNTTMDVGGITVTVNEAPPKMNPQDIVSLIRRELHKQTSALKGVNV